jgi:Flp pilus assembly protein TadD
MWALSRIPPLLGLALLVAACATTKSTLPALPPDIDPNDPTSATQLMRQGQIMIADGRVEEGIARYRMALQLQPDNPTIHNLLGVAELQRGQAKQALEHLNKALSLAPAYSDARNNRGAAYASLGQLAMAEADYLVVLGDTTHANRAGVYFNLGALYL